MIYPEKQIFDLTLVGCFGIMFLKKKKRVLSTLSSGTSRLKAVRLLDYY